MERSWVKNFFIIALSLLFITSCSRVSFVELQSLNPGNVALKNGLGENVSNYPVAVLNVNGAILGVAQNDVEYISLWNADPINAAQGRLETSDVATRFKYTPVDSNNPVIPQVSAMRYFQFDLAFHILDAFSFPEGSIVDFGDGVIQKIDDITPVDASMELYGIDNAGAFHMFIAGTGYNQPTAFFNMGNKNYKYMKYYADDSLKTITVYHNDNDYVLNTDNNYSVPTEQSSIHLKNLRGHLPKNTKGFIFSATQEPSFNTFSNVNLSEFISSLQYVNIRWGWGGHIFTNYNFGVLNLPFLRSIDFGSTRSNHGLTIKQMIGTTEIHDHFPMLYSIGLKADQYTSDLNMAIPNFKIFVLTIQDSTSFLTAADYERILTQLDSAKTDTGGRLVLYGTAGNINANATTAINSLTAKGVTVTLF